MWAGDLVAADPDAADLWQRLGLQRGAQEAEIKAAYRKLARRLHPDVNRTSDGARQFHRVTQAYSQLLELAEREEAESSVSPQTVMVLLAESVVGPVAEFYPAARGAAGQSATQARELGIVCVGQRGLAFVRSLSAAEAKTGTREAVSAISFQDLVSLRVSAAPRSPNDYRRSDDRCDVQLQAQGGQSMTLRMDQADAESLRNVQVRNRAAQSVVPPVAGVSLWARVRAKQLGLRAWWGRRPKRKRGQSRLPITNGWWVVGAAVLGLGLVLGAVLLG